MKSGAELLLRTTVIGAFPKPAYLGLPDWFRVGHANGSEGDSMWAGYARLQKMIFSS
jgi:hypothetical protein